MKLRTMQSLKSRAKYFTQATRAWKISRKVLRNLYLHNRKSKHSCIMSEQLIRDDRYCKLCEKEKHQMERSCCHLLRSWYLLGYSFCAQLLYGWVMLLFNLEMSSFMVFTSAGCKKKLNQSEIATSWITKRQSKKRLLLYKLQAKNFNRC